MRAHLFRFVRVGLAGLLVASVGCSSRSEAEPKAAVAEAPAIAVKRVAATSIKVPRVLTLSGSLVGSDQAQVAAGATGKILATYIERGSVVKKGAVLAKLDTRILGAQSEEAGAQVETLKAQQAQAHLDCERTQRMFDKGAIAKADYDRAQTQCVTAKWSLAAAEARKTQVAETLKDSQIRAPFSGLVVERAVTSGEFVRPDSRVVTLVAVDSLRVELTVPEADVARIKPGAAVSFRTSGGRGDSKDAPRYLGHVKYIGPAVRLQTRDAIVEATVDNPAHELRPGMFVSAELALGDEMLPAVPKSAIKSDGSQHRLFVVAGERLEERLVQIGDNRGALVPIVNGVKNGEMVVEVLTPDVRDGARVK
jgi:membrane fusion protein (multidrug efflux system)